jgi:hypothetical protein
VKISSPEQVAGAPLVLGPMPPVEFHIFFCVVMSICTAPTSERRGSVVIPLTISVHRSLYAASSANRTVAPAGIGLFEFGDHPQSRSRY